MNNLPKNKGFKYGFTLGVIFSFLAQLITFYDVFASVRSSSGVISHRAWEIGFPFPMYSGWYLILSNGEINPIGVVANLVFAVFFSVTLGLIYKFKGKIKNCFKNRAFIIGFVIGIISFLVIQYYDHLRNIWKEEELYQLSKQGISIDVIWSWGLPFPMYYWGQFILIGLIGNIFIAIVSSFVIGLIFKFVWSKIAARKLTERLERKRLRLQ